MTHRLLIILALFSFVIGGAVFTPDAYADGTLTGKIKLNGTPPANSIMPKEKNPEVCGTGTREITEVTVGAGGALKDAVVYFDKMSGGSKKWPAAAPQLNQEKCTFIPWMMVMQQKTELEIINRDPVLHNIHTYELIGKVRLTIFNEAQPTQGYTFKKKVKMRRSPIMKIECDAHNFMHAYMLVLKNPYYAITNADGSFSIDGIPAGKHKVTVWHSKFGKFEKEVEIGSGSTDLNHSF